MPDWYCDEAQGRPRLTREAIGRRVVRMLILPVVLAGAVVAVAAFAGARSGVAIGAVAAAVVIYAVVYFIAFRDAIERPPTREEAVALLERTNRPLP